VGAKGGNGERKRWGEGSHSSCGGVWRGSMELGRRFLLTKKKKKKRSESKKKES